MAAVLRAGGLLQVGRAFFQLLEVLSHAHAPVMAGTDVTTFAFMVRPAVAAPLRPSLLRRWGTRARQPGLAPCGAHPADVHYSQFIDTNNEICILN